MVSTKTVRAERTGKALYRPMRTSRFVARRVLWKMKSRQIKNINPSTR